MYKKISVLIFIIFHISSVIIWNLDRETDIPEKIIGFFKPYMYGMSLWQAWNIFSPDVYTKETSTRILIEKDSKVIPYLPHYAKEGMPLIFNRFRKLNDNIISHRSNDLNTAYLVYLCRKFNKIYEPEYDIELQIMYKDINLPSNDAEPATTYETIGGIRCS